MTDKNPISEFLNGMINAESDIDGVISEGIGNLKSKISEVEVEVKEKEPKKPSEYSV